MPFIVKKKHMNIKDQIKNLFHKNRQIVVAPNHNLVSQSARDLVSEYNLHWLTKIKLKNRGSPI